MANIVLEFDRSPNISEITRLQSLMESVQRAFNEFEITMDDLNLEEHPMMKSMEKGDFRILFDDYGHFKVVTANAVEAKKGNFDTLSAENLLVTGGFLAKELNAETGSYSKYLAGVKIYGDLIEANTLRADALILQGDDGIYRRLNIDSLGQAVVDSDPKYNKKLDGSVLVAESVTATHINTSSLFSQDITVNGNFHLGGNGALVYDKTKDVITMKAKQITAATNDGLALCDNNGKTQALFGTNTIHLGMQSSDARIYLCGDLGYLYADDYAGVLERMGISAPAFQIHTGKDINLTADSTKANPNQAFADSAYASINANVYNETLSDRALVHMNARHVKSGHQAVFAASTNSESSSITLSVYKGDVRSTLWVTHDDMWLDTPEVIVEGLLTAKGNIKTSSNLYGANEYLTGSLYAGGKTSSTDGKNGVAFGASGSIFMQGSNPTLVFTQAGTTTVGARIFINSPGDGYNYLKFKADNKYLVFREMAPGSTNCTAALYGEADGGTALGASSFRWYKIYCASNEISTSDEREKSDIMSIADYPATYSRDGSGNVFEKLFNKLVPKTYTLDIEKTNELHMGFIAQDVEKSMEELGLSSSDVGFVTHDYWVDQETGEEKDRYGLAYAEFIALNTYMIQKQQARIKSLEERIGDLERKVS